MKSIEKLKFLNLMVACLICCCNDRNDVNSGTNSREGAGDSASSGDGSEMSVPPSGYSGVWVVKNNLGKVAAKCDYVGGKKNGVEFRYYTSEGREGDLMAVQHYKEAVKDGISERYEMMTGNLLSRCEYRDGKIWSGAALDGGRVIDPDDVMVQDLPYYVVVYDSGGMVRKELSVTYFNSLKK